jgi:hypothetical protein
VSPRKANRQERESPQAAGAWGGKRVSFAARWDVASDFPAIAMPRSIQGFTFTAMVLLIRAPNAQNAQVVELVDTHV